MYLHQYPELNIDEWHNYIDKLNQHQNHVFQHHETNRIRLLDREAKFQNEKIDFHYQKNYVNYILNY